MIVHFFCQTGAVPPVCSDHGKAMGVVPRRSNAVDLAWASPQKALLDKVQAWL
eukprot:SAG11_NODE_681_length_7772_cov_26.403362_1_plen_53_part_00